MRCRMPVTPEVCPMRGARSVGLGLPPEVGIFAPAGGRTPIEIDGPSRKAGGRQSKKGGQAVIEVSGLTMRYGDKVAVDDLTYSVKPGLVTGFLGPNGAGKSTTMRIVLGLEVPLAGKALVNARPYASMSRPMRSMGALLDAGAVHGGRSARAHLACLARSNGTGRARLAAVLEQVGLTGVADERIGG